MECSRDGENYLLNIGPRADGSVPEPGILREVRPLPAQAPDHPVTVIVADFLSWAC
jgi:hypothetical protein